MLPSFVAAGIRSMPLRYDVRLRLEFLAAEVVEADIGRWATVTPDGEGCLVHMPTDSLDWPFMVLARTDAEFTVARPDRSCRELVAADGGPVLQVRRWAQLRAGSVEPDRSRSPIRPAQAATGTGVS